MVAGMEQRKRGQEGGVEVGGKSRKPEVGPANGRRLGREGSEGCGHVRRRGGNGDHRMGEKGGK